MHILSNLKFYQTTTKLKKNVEFIEESKFYPRIWPTRRKSLETGLYRSEGLTTDKGAGRAPFTHCDHVHKEINPGDRR